MQLLDPKTAGANGEVIYDVQFHRCGFFEDLPVDIHPTRKDGRPDYHFVFVQSGLLEFQKEGQTLTAGAGDVVYFPPHVPQFYCYKAGKGTLYSWIHFSGKKVPEILEIFPFQHGVYHLHRISDYNAILRSLLRSHSRREPGNAYFLNAQTQCLLIKMGQEIFSSRPLSRREAVVADMAARIREDPIRPFENAGLAKELSISQFHFIRLFKEQTGHSPQQYRTLMLLEKSKQLLSDTTLNINEIAYMLGLNDPLYFSRVFKKYTGLSPREFRKTR